MNDKVFITMEAGPNHHGLESAMDLVEIASRSGADAIKFQMTNPDKLMRDKEVLFQYQIMNKDGTTSLKRKPLYDLLKERELSKEELILVKRSCDALGLKFFCTALWEDQVTFLSAIGCDTVKICSSDINNKQLLTAAAMSGMSVQIDTGNAFLHEIAEAVHVLDHHGAEDVIIHHCPSGYPAITPKINLSFIRTLISTFGCTVAYSDHSPDFYADIAAIAIGARMIEKTITTDMTQDGPEHCFSLEEERACEFVRVMREIEISLGAGIKKIDQVNVDGRMIGRRSISASKDLLPGEMLTEDNTDFTRPEVWGGISPNDNFVYGRMVKSFIKRGELIKRSDI